jgi:hypothetical protein
MNLVEQLKEHWLGGIIAVAAICIGTTWIVVNEVSVKPRDFVIEQQKTTIADLKDKIKELQGDGRPLSNQPATSESATVLQPTWVYENQPILALDNQVLIKVSSPSSFIHSATFDLEIPEQEPIHWGVTTVGTRKTFTYKGNTYFFDVLDTSNSGAKVTIAKKL